VARYLNTRLFCPLRAVQEFSSLFNRPENAAEKRFRERETGDLFVMMIVEYVSNRCFLDRDSLDLVERNLVLPRRS
jgi:hypothetical protein